MPSDFGILSELRQGGLRGVCSLSVLWADSSDQRWPTCYNASERTSFRFLSTESHSFASACGSEARGCVCAGDNSISRAALLGRGIRSGRECGVGRRGRCRWWPWVHRSHLWRSAACGSVDDVSQWGFRQVLGQRYHRPRSLTNHRAGCSSRLRLQHFRRKWWVDWLSLGRSLSLDSA